MTLEQWEKARPIARELQDIQRQESPATVEDVEQVLVRMGFAIGEVKTEIRESVEKMGAAKTARETELRKMLADIGAEETDKP